MSNQIKKIYRFGPFSLDPVERRFAREGEPLTLQPKPFNLLLTLVEKNGQLITKEELLDSLWPDAVVEEGNLTRNISELRKILDDPAGNPQYIETVAKAGYRFIASVEVEAVEVNVPQLEVFISQPVNAVAKYFKKNGLRLVIFGAFGAFILACLLFVLYYVSLHPAPHPAPIGAVSLVISANPKSSKMYRVLADNSIAKIDRKDFKEGGHLEFSQIFSVPDAISVTEIALSFDEKRIFASDFKKGVIHVIDTQTGADVSHLPADKTVNSLALSADGNKLYAAVQVPVPEGRIMVFNTRTLKQEVDVSGVGGCPINLYAAPKTHLLFVATQCGGGHDPLYVVDTRSDSTVYKVPDLAVGSRVVSSPDGSIAFVSTIDKLYLVRDRMIQAELPIPAPVGPLAMTVDGRWLLVGSGKGIVSIDVLTGQECKRVKLKAFPETIAVAPNGAVYVVMLGEAELFETDSQALECQHVTTDSHPK